MELPAFRGNSTSSIWRATLEAHILKMVMKQTQREAHMFEKFTPECRRWVAFVIASAFECGYPGSKGNYIQTSMNVRTAISNTLSVGSPKKIKSNQISAIRNINVNLAWCFPAVSGWGVCDWAWRDRFAKRIGAARGGSLPSYQS